MFVTSREMYAAEEAVFATGVPAEELMDQAGEKIAQAVLQRFGYTQKNRAIAVVGKGNNGADSLVALRHLKEAGWQIGVRASIDLSQSKGLLLKKWHELGEATLLPSLTSFEGPGSLIILDGLLGIGTKGDMREPIAELAQKINAMREQKGAFIVAIDLPSGLDCDTGNFGNHTVRADLTCTLGSPKIGLIQDRATPYVGAISLLKLDGLSNWDLTNDSLITPDTLPIALLSRPFDFHKGQAGRVGIIAGSRGLTGAAALTSLGALRGGGGLITLFVKEDDYPVILPLIPPEVMVKSIRSYRDVQESRLDALAVGPGLGNAGVDVLAVIHHFKGPTVIDADALNLIATRSSISTLRPNQIVTPHPGEMSRLLPDLDNDIPRFEIARHFKTQSQATLLFKGARTIVTDKDSPLSYNTTGTPAMATGGQGDVLSGLLAALLARGIPPLEAAKFGAWLSGRASEIALAQESEESLSATSTAAHLGPAFKSLRSSVT